ncbi:hypothetical protein ARC78_03375 [Stenotrophomonas pictorum JCM 9942]|jgi:hypothetical protein|uniref:SseB protein N-terminal domain-containing protein n=1 Tax=Stenotrophomonas pictorum JCM 9942 TaxID=1236960 RepID=A0A0R0AIM2_9GAMM|nr:SseB family protein [Stenotrophomonas pictorum]KRG44863.1 hypothetical protein ARC78_03375 [Stenotrophomonas pictorum JCM 9942]
MSTEVPFTPLNDLEVRLLRTQEAVVSPADFLDSLLNEKVFVLLDKEIPEGGDWDETINPLVLTNDANEPMFAVFSAPERAVVWSEQVPAFENALHLDFRWLLGGIADGVGIVLNPGFDVGMEMVPDAVAQLKQRAAALVRAAGV